MSHKLDYINLESAASLYALFCERVKRTPEATAYRYFDQKSHAWCDSSWREMSESVCRWREALAQEAFEPGDRVAIMLRNCREWVMMDQAALSLGLVTVPLFTDDRAENVSYIIQDANVKLLLIEGADHWGRLYPVHDELGDVSRIITLDSMIGQPHDPRLRWANDWLPESSSSEGINMPACDVDVDHLATIIYTSGTTGRPKGVMLSHRNILSDARSGLKSIDVYQDDLFLSFLPLSHALERTVGYYIPVMSGATVAYARSINDLANDLVSIRPTIMISVPRVFEKVYNKIHAQLDVKSSFARKLFNTAVNTGWESFLHKQKRGPWNKRFLLKPILDMLVSKKVLNKLGGRMRFAICGGAALPFPVARMFIGLGLDIIQGYGLTESSPIISVNKVSNNDPESVGEPLAGFEVKLGEKDELMVRGDPIMKGYWNNIDATKDIIDADGWLHTGDQVRIQDKRIYITGRIKEIIVLANGEKVPPNDMEAAILMDPVFEQVLVVGEARPYLVALVVLNHDIWVKLATSKGLPQGPSGLNVDVEKVLLEKISHLTSEFPGYARINRVAVSPHPWTIDEGLITPTLKLRRNHIQKQYSDLIEILYLGH
ncbi:MAG: long-chain fatty acid--CoA ligase [Proteobacteria bacterium]|nr:long-chain fatty acid--CoA ligase [Pseudomonadota bacterium]